MIRLKLFQDILCELYGDKANDEKWRKFLDLILSYADWSIDKLFDYIIIKENYKGDYKRQKAFIKRIIYKGRKKYIQFCTINNKDFSIEEMNDLLIKN